nr:RNA-directed DNA polymerase, eukaryota [Tanacetum cinerariifolium]
KTSLWARVIKAIYGDDGKVGKVANAGIQSCWMNIVNEISVLKIRWVLSFESLGEFSVASVRKVIDEKRLSNVNTMTRWIKCVPIKVNVLAWKIKIDALPTRLNISHRGPKAWYAYYTSSSPPSLVYLFREILSRAVDVTRLRFRCLTIFFAFRGRLLFCGVHFIGSKRPGSDAVCYTKPLDSLKNWNDRFFWVDAFACLASFPWNTSKGVPKDPFPKSFEFNADHYATLVALPAPLGMDLLAFIRTADPTKVRVAERQRAEDEPRVLESTVGRVVPLLSIAPARASSKLEASVDRLFDEGASGHGQDADAPEEEENCCYRCWWPFSPPKKLREDFGALGGVSTAGKSMAAVQSLFSGAMLEAEARGEPVPTFPFVTSSVSATPEHEDRSPADSSPGPNLRTIGALQRFVISSDSSNHSGANIAEAEVDSIIRSSAPAIVTVTTAELLKTKDEEIESLKAQLLLKEAEAAEAIRLRAEVFKFESAERSLRGEVGFLRDQNTALEREKNELSVKVTDLSASIKVREQEVHELEISSAGLQEKVVAYEGFISQLEKFQDEKLEEVNENFDKLCVDFVEMALHLEEKFYPHLLTTIYGRRWLLSYGMELAVSKCLNFTEYLSALGAAISKAV